MPCCRLPQRAGHPHPQPPHLDPRLQVTSPCSSCPDVRDKSMAGPSWANGNVTLKIHSFKSWLWYFRHREGDVAACRSEGAEVVFGRRVQWRHCRYLPASATQRGSPLATSCCCCRVRLCPDLTSGALSAAATEEDLGEASIWNEFVDRIPNITMNLSNDLFSTNHYNILGFWMISAHLNMGSLIELLFNSSFEDALWKVIEGNLQRLSVGSSPNVLWLVTILLLSTISTGELPESHQTTILISALFLVQKVLTVLSVSKALNWYHRSNGAHMIKEIWCRGGVATQCDH